MHAMNSTPAPIDDYAAFIARKTAVTIPTGLPSVPTLNPALFPFQRDCVAWALRRGRAALFEDCGLGKTLQQLEWAHRVCEHTDGSVLILTPLAVAGQTASEAAKFGIDAKVSRDGTVHSGITITNYESLHKFDTSRFSGVVLDESSIIKAYSGKVKAQIFEAFASTPFKLACTATPAPNDILELGNHAEFLGVLTSHEMIARWFLPDTSSFGIYRLKGHAIRPYWQWVSTWARCVGKPSDMGYADAGFELPEMTVTRHTVGVDLTINRGEQLFRIPDMSATSVHREKRLTATARAARIAELVNAEPSEPWIIWCDTDYEADALCAALPNAVEVRGSDPVEKKERALLAFAAGGGGVEALITKPSIAGFGLNFQRCARVAFIGPTYSYEQWYQATRRTWRFGQTRPVHVHIAMADTEHDVWAVMMRKAGEHESMKASMFDAMRRAQSNEDNGAKLYNPTRFAALPGWVS